MKRVLCGQALSVLITFAVACPVSGAVWYADPVNGSAGGDGSRANPWPSLQWIVSNGKIESMKPATYPYVGGAPLVVRNDGAPVQPGDTIELLSGDHGDVWIVGYFNPDWITVKAADGHTPVLRHFILRGGCKWRLEGLTFSKEPHGTPDGETLVFFNTHSWHGPVSDCVMDRCHVYSADDSSAWTVDDWKSRAASGISAAGDRITIRNCTVRNVLLGINVSGDDGLVEHCTLEGLAHDGFRSGGDRIVWQYNTLRDFVKIDDNHDDIFQMYRGGGVPHVEVVIRGNFMDGRKIDGRPLTTSPQGIGCFDGPYVNCRVENNVVLTAHYHGLSFYQSDNCVIVNNTVIDPSRQYPAWITTPGGTNNVIRNNLSYSIPGADPGAGIVVDHNIELTDALSDQIFVDWRSGDVRLLAGGPAVDTGSPLLAPGEDVDGNARPVGAGFDIGAYEYIDAPIPGDADGDGGVDLADFVILKNHFGACGVGWGQGDFNGDGCVNLADFVILKNNFGR